MANNFRKIDEDELIFCCKCEQTKDVNSFGNNKSTHNGKTTYCKSCTAEYMKVFMKKNNYKYQKKYHKTTDKKFNERHRRLYQKRKDDPIFKKINNCRTNLYTLIKNGKCSEWFLNTLGCFTDDFKDYLQSKFKDGMSWDNYGDWEVDHIIPLFKAKSVEEVELLNNYTNLQPLWKIDNQKKYYADLETHNK